MRIGIVLCLVAATTACHPRNDPELINRISLKGAGEDIKAFAVGLSKGLAADKVLLGVELCTMKINLTLSANSVAQDHVGLAATGGYSGVTITGDAKSDATATDARGNTIEMTYRSIDSVHCPPQDAAPAAAEKPGSSDPNKPTTNTRSTNSVVANGPTAASPGATKPPATRRFAIPPAVATAMADCLGDANKKRNPQRPGEDDFTYTRRLCPFIVSGPGPRGLDGRPLTIDPPIASTPTRPGG